MALQNTNLLIQAAPLPATFQGGPQELFSAMLKRMKIVSPTGTNFIFIGDNEPTSNVGPWLKGGTQWWVWDENTKRYVPLDISASETTWYFIGNSTPSGTNPPVWLRTSKDRTDIDPSVGNPISWLVFNGTAWVPWVDIVLSGPYASVSATTPQQFTQFYATDLGLGVLIWYERGEWRTISGVPGDVKAVAYATLADALQANPGWAFFGDSNVSLRGRYIMQATKDPGGSPVANFNTDVGVAHRAAFETFGETDGVLIYPPSPVPYPPSLSLWHLYKK